MSESGGISELDLLFDLSPDLLCYISPEGYFIRVNEAFEEALGYSKEALLSKPILNFISPEHRENTSKQLVALAENETIRGFKNCYHCSDGSCKWFSWNAFQLPDKNYFASARDITLYEAAVEKLAEVSGVNEQFFDNALDVMCMFDDEGRFVRVNRAAQILWGYEEKELIGKYFFDLVHPDDRKKGSLIKAEIRKGNDQSIFENRILCKNATYLPVVWSATWLSGKQLSFAIARDATEIKKLEEQIRLKEQRLISLIESGNDIILILSSEGVYNFVSPSVKTILNSDPEFYLGKVTFQFIHPDDLHWVAEEFKAVLESEKPVHIAPFRFQVVSGDWVWIETMATNRLNDPAIEGIVINAKDVSAKREQEQEKQYIAEQLKLNNERYNLALKATKDIIWDWNLDTNKLNDNISFQKLFGNNPSSETTDAESRSWETCIFPQDKEYVLKSIDTALLNPEVMYWSEEYRYLKADKTIAFICDRGYIIRNEKLKAVRMVGAMQDITESKEKEQRILKQNEQLRDIAQINSHELRKPVATMLGLMDIFDKSSIQDQENQELLTLLESTVQELDQVIRRINNKASNGV